VRCGTPPVERSCLRSDTNRSSKSCAGLLRPIIAFVVGALVAALIVVTISVYGLGQFDPTYGPAISWQLMALSSLLLVGLNAVGFMIGLACVPMVVRQHVRRVGWLSAGTGALCVAIPIYAAGIASLVLVPLVAGVLTVAVMRGGMRFGVLIADRPRAVCSNCGYSVGASGSKRCPECGACAEPGEGGS
jgi:uncharacterized membrane protein YeaQ/YmgE (transglycosylase-associated protein family)